MHLDASPASLYGCPLPQSEDLHMGEDCSSIHLTLLDSYQVANTVTGAGDTVGNKTDTTLAFSESTARNEGTESK